MKTNEIRKQLEQLAYEYASYCYGYTDDEGDICPWDYTEEKEAIIDKWNALAPLAESHGISHAEMKTIWHRR